MGKYFGWVGGETEYFQNLTKANKFNIKQIYVFYKINSRANQKTSVCIRT